ncbi:MAG TPA: hypothetical protein VMB18_12530 [Terriglobales bacterium]|nr:hypothetical protein [Terriglobales bacterium]
MALVDSPTLVFTFSFVVLWLAAEAGDLLRKRTGPLADDQRENFGIVLSATLTLLGLLIGFTFSMAISRYDQRKTYEEAEANAIGTEFLRADLLPPADGGRVRDLLRKYLDQRVSFYTARDPNEITRIDAANLELQNQLWAAVLPASSQPSPVNALAVSGMNDVLNSQGYTQSAWWNRIPLAAWILMVTIGVCCNLLIGYGARRSNWLILLIVPIAVSIAFFLIADIDSPRGGAIRVTPKNLLSLSQSLPKQ